MLTTWPSYGTIWEGLESIASLEKMCNWGQGLRFQKTLPSLPNRPATIFGLRREELSAEALPRAACQLTRSLPQW